MRGKQGSGQPGPARGQAQGPRQGEDEHGVQGVQGYVGQVIPERVEAPEVIIHGVGEQVEGKVVGKVKASEYLAQALDIQPPYKGVLGYILGIVPVDELMAQNARQHPRQPGIEQHRRGRAGRKWAARVPKPLPAAPGNSP